MHALNLAKRTASRIGLVVILVVVFGVTANAYTVIMRGGRRVEIPSQFFVTASTLTYEVSPGVQITLAMSTIDIPATEKANNEQAGSLLHRAHTSPKESTTENEGTVLRATRSITNRDLEATKRRRRESELAYEVRRKQLGLPSVEESRKQAVSESDSIRIDLAEQRIAQRESESYWRERATALRTEMAALDGEITYVRARLEERALPNAWGGCSSVSFNTITRGVPFSNFGRGSFGNPGRGGVAHRPSIFVAPNAGARVTGGFVWGGGATRGQVLLNPGTVRSARPVGVGGHFPRALGFGNVGVTGWTFPDDYSYERGALITHFNELAAARAGLNARWRELEDEARRAGAQPGWLRP